MTNTLTGLVLLPRIRIQNANAISGPLSWGFPSPTAFTGFIHALERKFTHQLQRPFSGVGIVCHHIEPQISQPAGKWHNIFCLSRNPLKKDGTPSSTIEEGRAHLEVSLIIALQEPCSDQEGQYLAEDFLSAVYSMRIAGGSPLYRKGKQFQAKWHPLAGTQIEDNAVFRRLCYHLLPGFALVQREDLLIEHFNSMCQINPDCSALEALLDLTCLKKEPIKQTIYGSENAEESITWKINSKPGWLVPLPVGYAAITPIFEPGEVINARDEKTPFCFVENLYSLGQWISPHRLNNIEQILWTQEADEIHGLYRCKNAYSSYI